MSPILHRVSVYILGPLCLYRVCTCILGLQPFTRSILDSSPSSCSGVWDQWSCRIVILQFEQHCSTEAKIGFVPTFAQFFSFLILKSSSRTCSCLQKYRTSHRIAYCTLHWDNFEFTRLAHLLDSWQNVSAKSNLSWAKYERSRQTDLHLVASSYSESNSVFRLTPVRLVVSVLVYSLSRFWCCVLLQCSQFNITRLSKSESLTPDVLPCRSLRLWIRDRYSSQKLKVVAVHCLPHTLIWIVEQCGAVFASSNVS